MTEIKEICRLNFMRDQFSYVGTLRNQKRFNLNDNVFFAFNGNEITRGQIVGIELPPVDNPEYTYKIKIPEELVRTNMKKDNFFSGVGLDKITLRCDRIFNTIDEAKESAIKNTESMFKLQIDQIERYFKQFTKE